MTTIVDERRVIAADDGAADVGAVVVTDTRASWGAIWAGVFVAFAIEVLWTILMVGIFASQIRPAGGTPESALVLGVAVWLFVQTVGANYVGGWTAGKLAGKTDRRGNALHAFTVWSITTLLLFTVAIAPLLTGSITVIRAALLGFPGGDTAVAVATWLPIFVFITLLVSLVLACVGGSAATPRVLRERPA